MRISRDEIEPCEVVHGAMERQFVSKVVMWLLFVPWCDFVIYQIWGFMSDSWCEIEGAG